MAVNRISNSERKQLEDCLWYLNLEEMRAEVDSWQDQRNNLDAKIDWQFTSENARIKLKRLYPTLKA